VIIEYYRLITALKQLQGVTINPNTSQSTKEKLDYVMVAQYIYTNRWQQAGVIKLAMREWDIINKPGQHVTAQNKNHPISGTRYL